MARKTETLAELFEACGVSPFEAAHRARISYTTIWNIENGVVQAFRARIIAAIASACGVPADRVAAAAKRTAAGAKSQSR